MEKKGMFTGWKDVFSFTAAQNIKGKGYKLTTILIGLVIAIGFAAISIVMAVTQKDDSKDKVDVEEGFIGKVSTVYLVDNEVLDDELVATLVNTALSLEGVIENKITVEVIAEDKKAELVEEEKSLIIELAKNEEKTIVFNAITPNGSEEKEDLAEEYLEYVVSFVDVYGSAIAGVSEENIPYFMAPYMTQAAADKDDVHGMSVLMVNTLVPMLASAILFTMTTIYGQNVSKIVVAEKSSKLMEMLLTSIKPYALIAGKILATASLAICQVGIWIVSGFAGYKIGDIVATKINPDYINYFDRIMELMTIDNGANAFKWYSFVAAFVVIALGFLMYCVLAGLVGAMASKIEDLSTGMTLFQVPCMFGWLIVYLSPLIESKLILKLMNYVPFSSPFSVPGNIILGKCSILDCVISVAVLVATIFVLIIYTGKVYKGKLFNRK